MSKFVEIASALGALVMAATPLLALGGVARAAEPDMRPVHVAVGDLDFARAGDVAIFRQRVNTAAQAMCAQSGAAGLVRMDACRDAVRKEAVEKLGSSQRQDLAAAAASLRVASR